ncbi:MAG: hypothetical protein BWY83_03164 [bacterium ADurb.Bin478]|nr:MAG: hypothetical protein BWY83_03164 [bacterium ADurb.Bin478]
MRVGDQIAVAGQQAGMDLHRQVILIRHVQHPMHHIILKRLDLLAGGLLAFQFAKHLQRSFARDVFIFQNAAIGESGFHSDHAVLHSGLKGQAQGLKVILKGDAGDAVLPAQLFNLRMGGDIDELVKAFHRTKKIRIKFFVTHIVQRQVDAGLFF